MFISSDILIVHSWACGIELGSSVVITGGRYSLTTVTEYNEDGFIRYLPSLQQGRYQHGCSYYVNEGTKVDNDIRLLLALISTNIKSIDFSSLN